MRFMFHMLCKIAYNLAAFLIERIAMFTEYSSLMDELV